ncbi:MAG TPA: head GIN domain-containing protein [Fimbriimonadaceae bacterium]|nr:head GIN domain-containing protein [Fimbriimonadaceae bacterium]
MKNLWAIGAAGLAAAGCGNIDLDFGGPQVKGSGNVKTEARSVSGFKRIESRGAANCVVTVGKAASLKITTDDNILPLVETKVENGVLIIGSKGNYSTKHGIKAEITVPSLEGFAVSGSGDSSITGIQGSTFNVAISGSGGISGSGQADEVKAAISGSGEMDLSKLRGRRGEVTISGSGDVQIHVTESLKATIAGSGDIRYTGSPKNVQKQIAGSGDVHAG